MRHHHHSHRRRRPLGGFLRARLHRRIFAWLAGAVLLSAIASAGVMALGRVGEPPWERTMERGAAWLGDQFATVWDDVARREELARRTSAALEVNLELLDASDRRLALVGDTCRRHALDGPVVRAGVRVGTVRVCLRPAGWRWRWPAGLLVAVGLLWLASGGVARRLTRPLHELAEVVRRIGDGDLQARAVTACDEPDEVGLVAEAVNDMAERIEKQLRDQRELIAAVSHELRTPLARMRVISELARESGATPKTYDDFDREVMEMDALVGQLLANSRLDFGLMHRSDLPLRDVALRALERAGVPIDRLRFESPEPGGVQLRADPTLLQRALANLLTNALQHGGGVEALVVEVTPEEVRFEVLDRGPGLPAEGAERLFDKFQPRGAHGDGLGLGLALVKRIAEAHGGRVLAANRAGGGAAIGLTLPRNVTALKELS